MSSSLLQRLWLMRLHIPAAKMTKALSLAEQNDLGITLRELAAHHRAGGDVEAVVAGLVFAREHAIRLNWLEATAIDLAGASNGKSLSEVLAACVEPGQNRVACRSLCVGGADTRREVKSQWLGR